MWHYENDDTQPVITAQKHVKSCHGGRLNLPETSALFSVGRYLGLKVVSVLIASDKHPLTEKDREWKWSMSRETRYGFFEQCIRFALKMNS